MYVKLSGLVLCALLSGCSGATLPSRETPTAGDKSATLKPVLDAGVGDPLQSAGHAGLPSSDDLTLEEKQHAIMWFTAPRLWDAYVATTGLRPEVAGDLLRGVSVWPLDAEGAPWTVVEAPGEWDGVGFGVGPAVGFEAHPVLEYRARVDLELARVNYEPRATSEDFDKVIGERKAQPSIADMYLAKQLLLPSAAWHMWAGEYPDQPDQALTSLNLGVIEPLFGQLVERYPNSAFYKAADGSEIVLIIESADSQVGWLISHKARPGETQASLTWSSNKFVRDKKRDELGLWEKLAELGGPRVASQVALVD